MKHFTALLDVWASIDEALQQRRIGAVAHEALSSESPAAGPLNINANAYFMLLFSQFEAEVNDLCAAQILRGQAQPNWSERRAWDILDGREVRNLSFLKRAALLVDKSSTVYRRIKELYDTRNRIAHGGSPTGSLDLAGIAQDIATIAAQLKGAS